MKTANDPTQLQDLDLEQQKQLIAYQLWEDEGRPEGKAEEHWDKACLIVMSFDENESTLPMWLKRRVGTEAAVEVTATAPEVVVVGGSKNLGSRRAA